MPLGKTVTDVERCFEVLVYTDKETEMFYTPGFSVTDAIDKLLEKRPDLKERNLIRVEETAQSWASFMGQFESGRYSGD